MSEDIRKHVAHLINEIRRARGWNDAERAPLELHYDESANCKKHAAQMALDYFGRGVPRHSHPEFRPGWSENIHWMWTADHPYQAVEKLLGDLDESHLRGVLAASEFVAADVEVRSHGPHRMKHVFLCVRLK